MADFEIDIDKWIEKAGADAQKFEFAFAQNLATAIKSQTPVLTGNLRASFGVTRAGTGFNVFSALKGGDFLYRWATFRPDTENV
jgi:hypothetical protein